MKTFVFIIFLTSQALGAANEDRHFAQSPVPPEGMEFFHSFAPTPCQNELRSLRTARAIAEQFAPLPSGGDTIVVEGPHRNMFCVCSTPRRMVCSVVCTSVEMNEIVLQRISPERTDVELLPFTRVPTLISDDGSLSDDITYSIMYTRPTTDAGPLVTAELLVFAEGSARNAANFVRGSEPRNVNAPQSQRPDPPPPPPSYQQLFLPRWSRPPLERSQSQQEMEPKPVLTRSNSAFADFHFPDKYIPLQVCTDGTAELSCPISHETFEAGQTVYILKEDERKVSEGKSVCCISAKALRQIQEREMVRGGFRDPMRRTGDRLLTISDDYDAYIISESETEVRKSFSQNHYIVLCVFSLALGLYFALNMKSRRKEFEAPLI